MKNPRRTNGTKRSKLIARVKREESTCDLCGQWVDVLLPHGLPGSPEVDDPYDRTNCRLAHRYRWHRPVEPARTELHRASPRFDATGALIEKRPTPVTSRAW